MTSPALDMATAWDREYSQQGIPSSYRDEPSGVLKWALTNLPHISARHVRSAVDLGCGTGRNAVALADSGIERVDAIDLSPVALESARKRQGARPITFSQGDVTKPLPFADDTFDLAADVFVYFHQLTDSDRRNYRREIHRILKPGGTLLVSLATEGDGYYASCAAGPLTDIRSTVRLTWDPVAEVGNILLTRDEFIAEFSDLFELQMFWIKRKSGEMHEKTYLRETAATLWTAR